MRREVTHSPQSLSTESQYIIDQIFEWSTDSLVILDKTTGYILRANAVALELFGYEEQAIRHLRCDQLLEQKKDCDHLRRLFYEGSMPSTFQALGRRKGGGTFRTVLRYGELQDDLAVISFKMLLQEEELELLQREFTDLTFLHQQSYLKMQLGRKVLRMVVEQVPIEDTLNAICQGIEKLLVGIRVSICLSNQTTINCAAAPTMPTSFLELLQGVPILEDGLPCARAVYFEEEVIAENLMVNGSYAPFKDIIQSFNIQSCWSIPIGSSIDGSVLGTFAFYSEEPYFPQHAISDLIIAAVDLAEIALKQVQDREDLMAINQRYVVQNQELEKAKQQLEEDKALLLDREEKLKEAQRQSKVGSWEWDLEKQHLTWSEQQYQTYGLEGVLPHELYDAYRKCIHPADRGNFQEALAQVKAPNQRFDYEHRVITQKGNIRYIMGTGKVEWSEAGEFIGVKGTEQDVTALKEAEEIALQHELQFNELIANINEIVFMVNIKDHRKYNNPITYINGDTLNIFGYTHEELIVDATLWTKRIHPDDIAEVIRKGKSLHTTRGKVIREYRFQHKDGHYLWIEDNISIGQSDEDGSSRLYGSARNVSNRKKAEKASQEIQERLELAKEAARLGNYDWKIKSNTLHWDDRMHEIFGLDREKESLDFKNEHLIEVLHPEDRERVINQYLANVSDTTTTCHAKNSYRIILNGKIKYIESYVMYIHDNNGRVERVIGTCLDVTERREAEALSISNEEKDVLLKEIHHRVKNNLQVITSLLSLQSNSLPYPEQRQIFADSQYRINSMAIVHELLYQSDNLSKVNYKDYLSKLSQFLIRSIKGVDNKVHLDLKIEDVQLNIDTAIPLGLLINEVLTNSLKYGIPKDQEGIIFIELQSMGNDVENGYTMYQLKIGDNGVGYEDTINYRTTKSLGLKLIHNLTRQLGGTIRKEAAIKGTNYTILFKEA